MFQLKENEQIYIGLTKGKSQPNRLRAANEPQTTQVTNAGEGL